MKQRHQIFKEALNSMPTEFHSKEFCRISKDLGLPEKSIVNGHHITFLKHNCGMILNGHDRKGWWTKPKEKVAAKQLEIVQEPNPVVVQKHYTNGMTEDAAIKFLKERGYRILKMMEV